MNQYVFDLLNFFFPENCPVCGSLLPRPEMVICLDCERGLPRTYYSRMPDNPVARVFWGRVQVEAATSLFRFEKGSRYQKLVHRLKYQGEQEIGLFLGKLLGEDLCGTTFSSAEVIVPVPLHPDKLRIRGYNQSELISRGVSLVTGIPVDAELLKKTEHTDTQTRRSRYDRFTNVEGKFRPGDHAAQYTGKKLLLVDDVVTTGATLEACVIPLTGELQAMVFIATVGCA
ncbi:MAG: ComF family protein [Bacteroidota bacterium]